MASRIGVVQAPRQLLAHQHFADVGRGELSINDGRWESCHRRGREVRVYFRDDRYP